MNCEIFDFHCHPFEVSEQNICSYIDERPDSPDAFEVCMDRAGIVRFAGSVVERLENPTFEQIHELNEAALRLRDYYEGRFIPGIHIHPSYVKESCDELESMSKRGVKLIGELVPYICRWEDFGFDLASDAFSAILDEAEKYGMTVSFHSDENADAMDEMVRRHKNLTIVAAHPGEHPRLMRHIERAKMSENYYLDLSGTGLFRHGMLSRAVKEMGADHILFGTDYPVCTPGMFVGGVLYDPFLTDEEKALVFAGNAKRILNLS